MKDPTKTSRAQGLLAKIYSEGYCCMHAYLELCKIRGETPKSMGENIGSPTHTIRHHYRCAKKGERPCLGKTDCMKPILEQLKEKPSE
jgi:hypothetical protein